MVRESIRAFDKGVILSGATTAENRMGELASQRRLNTWLLSIFASLALAQSLIGIYGITHYSVEQRTREIGIRVAIGAQRANVIRMILGEGMKLTIVGLAIGLLAAAWLTRVMSNLLFGVSSQDPATFVGVALTLVMAGLLACYLPAQKASKVDPLVALRCE
jgi:ABC-type antimicrobial peptide transport system permease subunit